VPCRLPVAGGEGSWAGVLADGSVGLKEQGGESCFFSILFVLGIEVFFRGFPGSSLTQAGQLACRTAVIQHFKYDRSGCMEHTQCAASTSLGPGLAFVVV